LSYFLDARRLAAATIVLWVVAIFGLATSQILLSGVEGYDHRLPAEEPSAQRPYSGEPGRGCLI
jgi:hypothetical protein